MIVFNRDQEGKFQIPADGWFHLARFGEFEGDRELEDGTTKPVLQRINSRAVDALIRQAEQAARDENWPGFLVDFDHFSHDLEKSSEAAGWIENLQKRDTGLWAKIRLSDAGEAAIKGGRYRGISPVWDGPEVEPGVIEPHFLYDAGLTNKPNLRGMVPLSNRAGAPPAATNQNQDTAMKKILDVLGLDSAASEDAAVTKLQGIMNRAGQYDALKQQHDSLVGSIADSDLAEFGITDDEEKAQIRPMLIANREATRKLLARSKDKPADVRPGPIHNRKGAAVPANPGSQGDHRAVRNRAVSEFQAIHKCDFESAWNAVRAAKPELFTDNEK
ncbi:MAG: hypothetical protein Fur0032_20920 [Terrimicrobiaceae bacterium]